MSDKPKIVIQASEVPPSSGHWADRVPRKITDQTHNIVYSLQAPLDTPFRDFLALFLWDEDLGIRFRRVSEECDGFVEVEILCRRDDKYEIFVGIPKDQQ